MNKIILEKVYSREKYLSYMLMWNVSEYIGFKDFINYKIKNFLFKYNSRTNKTSVWYDLKEYEKIKIKLFEHVKKDKHFTKAIVQRLDYYWKIIFPFLSRNKQIKSIKEFDLFYEGITMWWSAMNTVYPLIQNPQVSKEHAKMFLNYREKSEKYTGEMDFLIYEFWKNLMPEYNNLIFFCTIDEMKQLYEGKFKDVNLLEKRKNGFYIYNMKVYIDDRFIKEKKFVLKKEKTTDITSVKGSIGFKGYAKGKVRRIINKYDINNFLEGEILVAEITYPDHVSAMKKAAAFVTDEGGITCHAAIVARELKKPCVIGTKIATQVFKDGDMVEVDANKGTVRKIN